MISETTLKEWEDFSTPSDNCFLPLPLGALQKKLDGHVLDLIKEVRELGKALVSEGCVPPAGWGRTRINNFTFDETEDA